MGRNVAGKIYRGGVLCWLVYVRGPGLQRQRSNTGRLVCGLCAHRVDYKLGLAAALNRVCCSKICRTAPVWWNSQLRKYRGQHQLHCWFMQLVAECARLLTHRLWECGSWLRAGHAAIQLGWGMMQHGVPGRCLWEGLGTKGRVALRVFGVVWRQA